MAKIANRKEIEMSRSLLILKLIDDQEDVSKFEAGEIGLRNLFNLLPDRNWPRLNLAEWATFFYSWFRRVEAAAYKFRNDPLDEVRERVAQSREMKPDIEKQLSRLSELKASSELEELGKFFVEEKLRWALGRLDAFTQWGYD